MNIEKKTPITIALMAGLLIIAYLFTVNVLGLYAFAQCPGGRHQGPPPEATTACDGKCAGDAAEFVSPQGDTIAGICVQQGGRLVLRPDNPPDRQEHNSDSG